MSSSLFLAIALNSFLYEKDDFRLKVRKTVGAHFLYKNLDIDSFERSGINWRL